MCFFKGSPSHDFLDRTVPDGMRIQFALQHYALAIAFGNHIDTLITTCPGHSGFPPLPDNSAAQYASNSSGDMSDMSQVVRFACELSASASTFK